MKKKDFVSYLMAHGQAFAIGFLLIIALSISMVIFLIIVVAATWLNKLFH